MRSRLLTGLTILIMEKENFSFGFGLSLEQNDNEDIIQLSSAFSEVLVADEEKLKNWEELWFEKEIAVPQTIFLWYCTSRLTIFFFSERLVYFCR